MKLEVHGDKAAIDKSIDAVVNEYGGAISVSHYGPSGKRTGSEVYFGGKEMIEVDAEGNIIKFPDEMVRLI